MPPKPDSVHMLWTCGKPGLLETACVRSFLAHGHRVRMWVYEDPGDIGAECEVVDAREIMPASSRFAYESGPHAGSWVGFSDIFRYAVLLAHGGWWVDMDVFCMRNLDGLRHDDDHLFRWQNAAEMCAANIIHAPRGSEVMERCLAWSRKHVNSSNTYWLAATSNLHDEVARGHPDRIVPEHILGGETMRLDWMFGDADVSHSLAAIHWCSENMRLNGFPFAGHPGTTYKRLIGAYL